MWFPSKFFFIGSKRQNLLVQSLGCMVDGQDISRTASLVVIGVGCMRVGIIKENQYHAVGYSETSVPSFILRNVQLLVI